MTDKTPPTDNLARLRRLRDQLAAEHAKAVRADQQPRPDLDHLRVTAHNGIAAGLEIGLFFVDHHLREVGEQPARTTANNAVASGNAADNPLREQYAAAIEADAERPRDERVGIINAVLAVRDAELERIRQQLDFASEAAKEGRSALTAAEQQRDQLAAALRQALDAFEAYWARASYCGPGETAIQPEHLQAWRAVLNSKEQP